jgi:hypothetical protein
MINHILLTGWLYIVRSTQYSKVWNGSGDQWRRLLRRLAIGRGDCRGVRQWQEDSLSLDRGWYMQNSCMKVLVYCCIFQQIKVLWNVIIMFCIDLWGFYIDPPYFGYNSTRWETPVLCILMFQRPFGTQIERAFFWRYYLYMITNLRWRSTRGATSAQMRPSSLYYLPEWDNCIKRKD